MGLGHRARASAGSLSARGARLTALLHPGASRVVGPGGGARADRRAAPVELLNVKQLFATLRRVLSVFFAHATRDIEIDLEFVES